MTDSARALLPHSNVLIPPDSPVPVNSSLFKSENDLHLSHSLSSLSPFAPLSLTSSSFCRSATAAPESAFLPTDRRLLRARQSDSMAYFDSRGHVAPAKFRRLFHASAASNELLPTVCLILLYATVYSFPCIENIALALVLVGLSYSFAKV